MQTPVAEPPLMNMMATPEPESSKQHCERHKYEEISGRINSEKENSCEEDLWHNWHKSEKASGTEVAAVLQL